MAAGRKKLDVSIIPVRNLIGFDACTRCGECSVNCPTGGEAEEKEERTPRGKIRAIKRIRRTENNPIRRAFSSDEKLQRLKNELARSAFECTICGMCAEACPLSLDTIEMWESIRESLVASGLGPLDAHDALIKSIENYDNPWMQPRAQRGRWAKMRSNVLDATKEPVDILYYVGCTASYDPDINIVANNLATILNAAGIRFGILGKDEKCCGSTLLRLGLREEAKKLAEQNIEMLAKTNARTIVTACAGCYKTLRQDYPKLTGSKTPVVHVTEFLAKMLREGRIPLVKDSTPLTITYHDPCHLGRHTKMYDWPREILGRMPGITLIEMERTRERSRCCGAGAGLKTLDQELALKIAEKRIEDAETTGASILVTACPFCEQTLREAVQRRGEKITVADITEIIAQRMMK